MVVVVLGWLDCKCGFVCKEMQKYEKVLKGMDWFSVGIDV